MIAIITIPALFALVLKALITGYSLRGCGRDKSRWLFVCLPLTLAVHDLIEFVGLNHFVHHGPTPQLHGLGIAYIASLLVALAFLFHLALRLNLDPEAGSVHAGWQAASYVPGAALLYLLFATEYLVVGFEAYRNTVLRVPGPLYPLFEGYVLICLVACTALFLYGSRRTRRPAIRCVRSRWWLLAIAPTALLLTYLIIANHFGLARVSSTIYLPITLTFFLLVTTYATHRHRLFDISFWIPGSPVRRQKAAFYRDLRSAIAEVEAAGSLDAALEGVSRVLRCPVAVVGGYRAELAMAGEGSLELAQFPHDVVAGVKRPLVAEEIRESEPETHRWMKQFAVAAIVPLGSDGSGPQLWLLLGEAFSETVYSPADFRQVERLFGRIGALYADGLSVLRRDLDQARTALRALRERLSGSRREKAALRHYTQRLMLENHELRRDRDRQPGKRTGDVLRLVPVTRPGEPEGET